MLDDGAAFGPASRARPGQLVGDLAQRAPDAFAPRVNLTMVVAYISQNRKKMRRCLPMGRLWL
jgi:hypothetical protein